MEENCIWYLGNGIKVIGRPHEYSIWQYEKNIHSFCTNFAYVKHVLLAVRTDHYVYIYSLKSKAKALQLLKKFNVFCSPAFVSVKIGSKVYNIDFNCNIKAK